jgi:putative transposase
MARSRVASALDRSDREAKGHVATTSGIPAEDVKDLMVAAVAHRYGQENRAPEPIGWLTGNGSCYTSRETRAFARNIGLVPRTTPVSSRNRTAWRKRSSTQFLATHASACSTY